MYSYIVLICAVLALVNSAEASSGYDFGDFLATVLGIGFAVIGILACLGNYARKQAGNNFI